MTKIKYLFTKKYCCRCGGKVKIEWFIKDYPFYCPDCDENMYSFEVYTKAKARNKEGV